MRYLIFAAALVAGSAIAQVEAPAWKYVQDDEQTRGLLLAFVEASDGNQLVFKCDMPGKYSVYAMYSSDSRLGRPGPIPSLRTVTYRFDGGAPNKDSWRYYEHIAVALHTSRERALLKLLQRIGDAKQLEMRVEPLNGAPITSTFDIVDAQQAIARVYESCKDDNPLE